MFDPVVTFFAVVVAVAVVYLAFFRKKPEQPGEPDVTPSPVVSMHIQPPVLKFGESYTASWNSYGVEALQLSWTGPDGGNAGMSLSVPSGSVTNPTGPVGTYDFTLVGTDVNGNVVATAYHTLVVEPAKEVAPLEVALEANTAELAPIVIGPSPVVEAPALDPIVVGPTPAKAVKKPAAKKPTKKAAPKKPAKKAAPKKR